MLSALGGTNLVGRGSRKILEARGALRISARKRVIILKSAPSRGFARGHGSARLEVLPAIEKGECNFPLGTPLVFREPRLTKFEADSPTSS
jgi:hypothetical protein